MTKACYVGVSGAARKVKKIYAGVDNTARKVKKAYVGVGGVARPFFNSDSYPVYCGQGSLPSSNAKQQSSAVVGDYAIVTGGISGSGSNLTSENAAYAYSANSLLLTAAPSLSVAAPRYDWAAAANIGSSYAIFAGGGFYKSSTFASGFYTAAADAYNASLVRTSAPSLHTAKGAAASGSLNGYGIVAGGVIRNASGTTSYDTAEAYSASLTKTTIASLPSAGADWIGVPCGDGNSTLFYGEKSLYGLLVRYSANLVQTTIEVATGTISEQKGGCPLGDGAVFCSHWGTSAIYVDQNGTLGATTYGSVSLRRPLVARIRNQEDEYALAGSNTDSSATEVSFAVIDRNISISSLTIAGPLPEVSANSSGSMGAAFGVGNYAAFVSFYKGANYTFALLR